MDRGLDGGCYAVCWMGVEEEEEEEEEECSSVLVYDEPRASSNIRGGVLSCLRPECDESTTPEDTPPGKPVRFW